VLVPDVLTLTVRSVRVATPLTRIVRLDLDSTPFTFQAGQGALIGLHGQSLRRPYSIASSPDEARTHQRLEFLLRVDATGTPGAHLGSIGSGSRIDLEGPFGGFTLPPEPAPAYLFIAGGTGIAPIRSMVRHLIATSVPAPLAMLYSARSVEEFPYGRELERLARRGLITLLMTVTGEAGLDWKGERGRIGRRHLERVLPRPDAVCFVCGPPLLVEDVPRLLQGFGVRAPPIRFDEW
jgi:ferredoxin-NADP reductase